MASNRSDRFRPLGRVWRMMWFGAAGVGALIVLSWIVVGVLSRDKIVSVSDAPDSPVVIVPGARVRSDGLPTLALRQRLDAAAALYERGATTHVLVSGDNRTSHYNEPVAMQQYLRTRGVPEGAITLDYAGFDTWDTCLRAVEQFGVSDAVVVTQPRFAQRTASLCATAGIDVTVATTDDYLGRRSRKLQADTRERMAVVKAVADIIRTPEAHHGGPFVGLVGSDDDDLYG